MAAIGMPIESKTKGRTRQTCSTVYGSVAVPDASATPPTRRVELVPDTDTVWGCDADDEPAGTLAHAAAPARKTNEKRRIRLGADEVWVVNRMHAGTTAVKTLARASNAWNDPVSFRRRAWKVKSW
jgi:hypothetical protein